MDGELLAKMKQSFGISDYKYKVLSMLKSEATRNVNIFQFFLVKHALLYVSIKHHNVAYQ
jgi:hypothetical protein